LTIPTNIFHSPPACGVRSAGLAGRRQTGSWWGAQTAAIQSDLAC